MAVDYNQVLLEQGALLGIEGVLQGAVPNLNTNLGLSHDTSIIISSSEMSKPGPVLSSHIQIGNFIYMWDLPSGGPIRVRICLPSNGPAFSAIRRRQAPSVGAGLDTTINTDIYIYFHGDLWQDGNNDRESRRVMLAQSCVMDWVRTTFNAYVNRQLVVPSLEYGNVSNLTNPLGNDTLSDCFITTGSNGYFKVNFEGDRELHAVHLVHTGVSPT